MPDPSSGPRAGLCIFTFADGRQCSMLQADNDSKLCYFHVQDEHHNVRSYVANLKICRFLDNEFHTASDLSAAFASLFCAGVMGYTEPKNTQALTKLGQLMLKTHLFAKAEYLSAYEADWGEVVAESNTYHPHETNLQDIGNPASLVAAPPDDDSEQPTPQPSVQPPKSPQPQKIASATSIPASDPPSQTRPATAPKTASKDRPVTHDSAQSQAPKLVAPKDRDPLKTLHELQKRLDHHFLKNPKRPEN